MYKTQLAVLRSFRKNCLISRWTWLVFLLLSTFSLQAQTNLLVNPDFEEGLTGWSTSGDVVVVDSAAQSGNNAIRILASSAAEQVISGLTPNTTYELTGWAKSSDGSPVRIGVKQHGGNEKKWTVNSTGYVQVSLKFTTGPAHTHAKIYVRRPNVGSGTGYGDNFSVTYHAESPYRLVWSDEFNGTGPLNENDWNHEYGFKRNRELQWYQKDNAFQQDGNLVIEARRDTFPNPWYDSTSNDWKKSREFVYYTSSSVSTRAKHFWQYGRFEVRAKITNLKGTWPAIWTLGTSCEWPSNGEVDIMENYQNKILANYAWGTDTRWKAKWDGANKQVNSLGPDWVDSYHTWTLDWDKNRMSIYVDDIFLNDVDLNTTINGSAKCPGQNPFQQPHYIILNLAIGSNGGDPSGTEFPNSYLVDYVRIYQKEGEQPIAPVAKVNGPGNGQPGEAINFSSEGSYDPDGSIFSYFWQFGDGNISTSANPAYTYAVPGYYTVKLTVTDNEGESATDEMQIYVASPGTFFYVENFTNGYKLRPDNAGDDAQIRRVANSITDEWVQWELVLTDSSYFYFKNRETGKYFRPVNYDVNSRMQLKPASFSGNFTQWKLVSTGDGYAHIFNRETGMKFPIMGTTESTPFIEQTGTNATGVWTKWKLVFAAVANPLTVSLAGDASTEIKVNGAVLPAGELIEKGDTVDVSLNGLHANNVVRSLNIAGVTASVNEDASLISFIMPGNPVSVDVLVSLQYRVDHGIEHPGSLTVTDSLGNEVESGQLFYTGDSVFFDIDFHHPLIVADTIMVEGMPGTFPSYLHTFAFVMPGNDISVRVDRTLLPLKYKVRVRKNRQLQEFEVEIDGLSTDEGTLLVHNLRGDVMKSIEAEPGITPLSFRIPYQDMERGLYVLRIYSGDLVLFAKVIVWK